MLPQLRNTNGFLQFIIKFNNFWKDFLCFFDLVIDLLSFILLHLEQFILRVGVYPVRLIALWRMKLLKVIATPEKVMLFSFYCIFM